jgi:hypothetical protein
MQGEPTPADAEPIVLMPSAPITHGGGWGRSADLEHPELLSEEPPPPPVAEQEPPKRRGRPRKNKETLTAD